MNPTNYAPLLSGGLFLGMLVLLEVGRRIGFRRLAQDPEGARQGLGVPEGAVFSILGLLIAFTFSGAATRFDSRRDLVAQEANDIGTAWLRLDLVPADKVEDLRDLFRQYLDARIEAYRKLPDIEAAEEASAFAASLQGEIWAKSMASLESETSSAYSCSCRL
jgi:hypothetical protein